MSVTSNSRQLTRVDRNVFASSLFVLNRLRAREETAQYGAPKSIVMIIDRASQECTSLPWAGVQSKGLETTAGKTGLTMTGAIIHGSPNQEKRIRIGIKNGDQEGSSLFDDIFFFVEQERLYYQENGLEVSTE